MPYTVLMQPADTNGVEFFVVSEYKTKSAARTAAQRLSKESIKQNGVWAASYFVAKLESV